MMVAAEATAHRPRRRPHRLRRLSKASVPYLLILPVVVVITAILGYPLFKLVTLSVQQFGLPGLIQRRGPVDRVRRFLVCSAGRRLLAHAPSHCNLQAANIGLTMGLELPIAFLLVRVSPWVRVLLTAGLILVSSMPAVVAVQVWYSMSNLQNGIVDYALTELGVGDYGQHDWYAGDLLPAGDDDPADRLECRSPSSQSHSMQGSHRCRVTCRSGRDRRQFRYASFVM